MIEFMVWIITHFLEKLHYSVLAALIRRSKIPAFPSTSWYKHCGKIMRKARFWHLSMSECRILRETIMLYGTSAFSNGSYAC